MVDVKDLAPSYSRGVRIICDGCGVEYTAPYNSHYKRKISNKKDLCHGCASAYGHGLTKESRAKKHFDRLDNICKQNGYELITRKEDYDSINMHIPFKCPKHGVQTMLLGNLLSGHKCLPCSYETRGDNRRNTLDYVEGKINSINGNKLLNKEDYFDSRISNLKVLCGKCGKNIFLVSFSSYTNRNIVQCKSCSSKESVGEKKVADWLKERKIDFVREKKFVDCKDIKALPFDFYVPKYNLLIEFDGQHHYFDVWGTDHFRNTQRHDEIKNQYCEKNSINLLRIPYWNGNYVGNLIEEKINSIVHR